jgi:hypothetical protein
MPVRSLWTGAESHTVSRGLPACSIKFSIRLEWRGNSGKRQPVSYGKKMAFLEPSNTNGWMAKFKAER